MRHTSVYLGYRNIFCKNYENTTPKYYHSDVVSALPVFIPLSCILPVRSREAASVSFPDLSGRRYWPFSLARSNTGEDPARYLTWLLKEANNADLKKEEVIQRLLPWNAPKECRAGK